ncbi:hypothetical protein DFA_08327 [Cavenderia fasciculata]|uniref:Uncharacterized protein n=1 Tax=Cavenderia fasciculata TaxID=261658 RepID=F4Q5S3_CACFS|nr:uncharacterized protein DFA_08327 [Cavenderia fasciculata]EGG17332.1 hypothetical protein DFA_08327 [Cavenderia fasciculata]|eukprot:XP_004355816.1 hypothetical protein DFA_08327 [Cavenderia fasciculata]
MNKKIVLVTGCSSGIGKSFVRELGSRRDYKVYASARNLDSIRSLENEGFDIVELDVTKIESIEKAVNFIIDKEGRIDLLINNAGISDYSPLVELNNQDAHRIMETNFFGTVNTTNAVAKHMIAQKSGVILCVGSIVGLTSTPFAGMYCASKAAVHSWSDSLRLELIPFNIKVVVVMPGSITSEISNNAKPQLEQLLSKGSLYDRIKGYLIERSTASQDGAISSESFVKYTLDKTLSPKPPASFSYGPNSFTFNLLYYLPKCITIAIFSRRFGLIKLKELYSHHMMSSLLKLSNLLLLYIISSIDSNGDIICLLLTCKHLYHNIGLRRSVQFKGIRVIDTDKKEVSKQFKATSTLFKLLSFKDILENSISHQQIVLSSDLLKQDDKDYPDWVKQRITLENRQNKSNITTALVKNAPISQTLYDIQSIETLFIYHQYPEYGSTLDLGSVSLFQHLQRLSVCAYGLILGTHTTLKSLELSITTECPLADLELTKFVSLTKLIFNNPFVTDIGPGLFPSSLTYLNIRPKEIPPRDTFLSLTSLVYLKIGLYHSQSIKSEQDQQQQQPFIDLDGLYNLKTLMIDDDSFPPENKNYYIEMSVPPSLTILNLLSVCIKIPTRCTMPLLEKLDVQLNVLIDGGGKINLVSQCKSLKKLVIHNCNQPIPPMIIPSNVEKLSIYKFTKKSLFSQVVLPPSLTHLSVFGNFDEHGFKLPDSLVKLKLMNNQVAFPSLPQQLKKLVWIGKTPNLVYPSDYPPNIETVKLTNMAVALTIDNIPPPTKYLSLILNKDLKMTPKGLSIFSIGSRLNKKIIDSNQPQQQQQWLPYNTTHLTCDLCGASSSKVAFRLDQVINHTNVRNLSISAYGFTSCRDILIQRLDPDNRKVLVLESHTLAGGIITQRRKTINNNNQHQQQQYDPIYLYLNISIISPFQLDWGFLDDNQIKNL